MGGVLRMQTEGDPQMRRIASLVLGLSLCATNAWAQLNCTGGACATTKYGLGQLPGFRLDKVPADQNLFDYTRASFGPNIGGSSFYYSRGSFISGNANCGGDRGFAPYTGQIFVRERTDCTPTGIGPTCVGGTAPAGTKCHLVPADGTVTGYVNPFRAVECPGGGVCTDSGGGCRVEIPDSDGGGVTPVGETSDALLPTLTVGVAAGSPFVLNAHASQTWGGSSHGVCSGTGALCKNDSECSGAPGSCILTRGTCRLGPTPGKICLTDAECGTGGTCPLVTCSPTNFRYKPSMGTRYKLPPTHPEYNGSGNQTYVRWDYGQVDPTVSVRVANNTAIRTHSDDSSTCCASTQAACDQLIPPTNVVYPLLLQRTCAVANRYSFEDNVTNDWIFPGGRGTAFYTDPSFSVPGQIAGLCKNAPQTNCTAPGSAALCTVVNGVPGPYNCCTGVGTGPTCGNECGAGDSCDLTEPGHRAQIVNGRDTFGDPRNRVCGANMYVLRGSPSVGCTLEPQYVVAGDPGDDCGLFNFGRDRRYDGNCDGVEDIKDGCPFLSEWDQTKDSDGDCGNPALPGYPAVNCRLDECECGDEGGNGSVTVSDLVSINLAIFQGVNHRLCDANSDLNCNVSDIVSTNKEIFTPDSSTCRHITSNRCGNNVRDSGEACDNGARCQGGPTPGTACNATGGNTCGAGGQCIRVGGDGCNTSCRVEFGWTCTGAEGSPSVCTQP